MYIRSFFQHGLGVAAVTLALAAGANAQTIGCTIGVGNGGNVPTSGTGNGTYPTVAPSFPMTVPLTVTSIPSGATHVTSVQIVGATHTYVGDVQWILQDPAGNKFNVFNRQGGSCDYAGDYTFVPPCTGGTALVTPCTGPIASGTYDQNFGTWPNGNLGINNTVLSLIPAATGVWNLIGYDWVGGDIGSITSWNLCFGTPTVSTAPPAAAPALTAPANAATVTGPFVNLTWNAVACSTGYDVEVDGTIFNATSSPFAALAAVGAHTWRVRAKNSAGTSAFSALRTFTVSGTAVPALTAPANAANVNGPVVTLTWGAVAGATSYDIDVDGTVFNSTTSAYLYTSAIGTHTWKVRANWATISLVGNYSASRTFNDLGPLSPTLTSPADGAFVFGPVVTLTWNNIATASGYDVDVDGTVTAVTTNSYTLTTSTPGAHLWSVRAKYVGNTIFSPYALARTYNDLGAPPASTCVANGTFVGLVPASGTGGGAGTVFPTTFPPSPYVSSYNVTLPPGATQIVKVELNFSTVQHTWINDLQVVLKTPTGTLHNVFCRPGGNCDLNGIYSIYEAAPAWPTCPTSGDIPPGNYIQDFGTGTSAWPTGTSGVDNTPLGSIPVASGIWELTIYDWVGGDSGQLDDWKICFDTGPALPVAYCTAGTTTNGCNATISATANPSVTAAVPCTINVANVEGQKSGLIFYSITGRQSAAWNASSFLCVKAPTQRTTTQNSGGTVGACDGTLTLDWNAFQAANPTALGNPWAAGSLAQAQAWFRDPPAGKSTNLSNGIEMTYVP
ncbi:MAG: hypothetical protein FJ294_05475 [Planctomycetes bacterium]|nr:hypothetical protein [Planctomycetota bacterium]